MATLISTIETKARRLLEELTPRHWTSDELVDITADGIRDLWRSITDLKQEHFFTLNEAVTLAADATTLTDVPTNVHKVYLIRALNAGPGQVNAGLRFEPREFNSDDFIAASEMAAISPSSDVIFYAISAAGGPVAAPTIYCAPKVTSEVEVSFAYIPNLGTFTAASTVPIPGEADNALVAWTVAFARAKEREDRAPDPSWLSIYSTEKQSLLQSLGLRQYQEPTFVDGFHSEYW